MVTGDTSGPQPVDIGARVVAHIAHRIPLVRSFNKKAEGKDKKAGILADLMALGAQLYEQNAELLNEKAGNAIEAAFNSAVSGRPTAPQGMPADGPLFVDFGAVAPNGDNANNNGGI